MNDKKMLVKDEEQEVNLREMDPLKVIKAAAEGIGLILNDPKPNCKKCHGRGYLGRHADTGEPVACSCLFPKYDSEREPSEMILPQNREQRRAAKRKNGGK
jgi:hypothetical protein